MLTRRRFALAISVAAARFRPSWVFADEGDVVVNIRVDESVRNLLSPAEEDELKINRDSSEQGKALAQKAPKDRALPIMLIIVGAIAIIRLLEMIQELYRKTYYGGVLIDTRTKPVSITNDLKIPANMVFVIEENGKTDQYTGDKFDLSALHAAFK